MDNYMHVSISIGTRAKSIEHVPMGEEHFPPQEMMRFFAGHCFDSVQQLLVDSLAAELICK